MGQMSTHRQANLRHAGVTATPRDGFSLLELLAVISIMALLSTLAVTSYFSAVRGMAFRSAKRHFENALVQARQRACMDGVRVSVMAFNEVVAYDTEGQDITDTAACYVVCKEIGRFSFIPDNQEYFVDEFADLETLFPVPRGANGQPLNLGAADFFNAGLLRLYNLDQGFWTQVRPYAEQKTVGNINSPLIYSGDSHTFKAYAFVKQGKQSTGAQKWKVGEAYGVEVAPVQSLPKKYLFANMNKDNVNKVICVTFEPDGSCKAAQSFTIVSTAAGGKNLTFKIDNKGIINIP